MRFFFSRLCMACKKNAISSNTATVTTAVSMTMCGISSVTPGNGLNGDAGHVTSSLATGAAEQMALPEISGVSPSLAGELFTKKLSHGVGDGGGAINDSAALLAAANRVRTALRSGWRVTMGAADTTTVPSSASTLLAPVAPRGEKEKDTEKNGFGEKLHDGFGSKKLEDVSAAVALLLEKDTTLSHHLLASLSGDSLRLLLVVATALEYFGQDAVESQLRVVDKDRDDNISSQEYDAWINTAVRERAARRFVMPRAATSTINTTAAAKAPTNTNASIHNVAHTNVSCYISWGLWHRIALSAAIPFMAFGVLDNAIFVTVGDAIDKSFAEAFNLSKMAAAALGGVVSGTAGIQMHGIAVRVTQKSRLAQTPELTPAQHASASCWSATRVGSVVGMVLGLLFGMTPLFFLSPSGL